MPIYLPTLSSVNHVVMTDNTMDLISSLFTSFRPKTSFLPIKTATVLALWYYVPLLTFVSCSFPHWSRRWRFAVDVTWLQWGTCDCRGTADIYSLLGMVWSWHAKHAQLKSNCLRQITLGQAFSQVNLAKLRSGRIDCRDAFLAAFCFKS